MWGSHLSIAGGMENALTGAAKLGLDTVQVFTKNQQQWTVKPLEASQIEAWNTALKALGWARTKRGQSVTVSHASYLINLASVSDDLWKKSVDLMTEEVARCEALGIAYVVHHPGSFKDWDIESGMKRIVDAYGEILTRTKGFATTICLEGTVGAGSQIGGRLEHLSRLREMISAKHAEGEARVGYCLDTCHLHAAGYDLSTAVKARAVVEQIDDVLGWKHVRVLHINDSKGAAGSKLDRHEHIGQGTIGTAGFKAFLSHKAAAGVPKILETPKEGLKDGEAWDVVNLKVLKTLVGK